MPVIRSDDGRHRFDLQLHQSAYCAEGDKLDNARKTKLIRRAITLIGVSGLIAAISAEKRPLSGKNGTFPRAERPKQARSVNQHQRCRKSPCDEHSHVKFLFDILVIFGEIASKERV